MTVKKALSRLLSLCVLVYFFYIGIKSYIRYNEFKHDYNVKKRELLQENVNHKRLKQQLVLLEQPETWEYLAKKELGFVKSNEHVYKLVEKE